ncbi:MAG: TetR/AcrR family transcriptional regulator [Methyloligellaceae bacterium]
MPYTAEHKAETRKRIVQSARRLFNRYGFSEVSIDDIMAGAGLTRGGFYNHFKTKDELYAEAVTMVMNCNPSEAWDDVDIDFDAGGAKLACQIVDGYLSRQHYDDIDLQCPLIALPSDVARGGEAVKTAFRKVFESMVTVFEAGLEGGDEAARRRAMGIATLCVGGMVLARAVDDDRLADEIRGSARAMALEVSGWEGPVRPSRTNA